MHKVPLLVFLDKACRHEPEVGKGCRDVPMIKKYFNIEYKRGLIVDVLNGIWVEVI